MSVGIDQTGLYRITEVVLGGAAGTQFACFTGTKGTQFAGFTGTKAQILTPAALQTLPTTCASATSSRALTVASVLNLLALLEQKYKY
jgi:hypothetical protein